MRSGVSLRFAGPSSGWTRPRGVHLGVEYKCIRCVGSRSCVYGGRSNVKSSSGESGIEGQTVCVTNLVCLIIQAICSVEHPAAGIMRSPSFSRDSSSITTTNSPRAMAAIALSTVSNAKVVRRGGVRSFGALRGGEERLEPSGMGRV